MNKSIFFNVKKDERQRQRGLMKTEIVNVTTNQR